MRGEKVRFWVLILVPFSLHWRILFIVSWREYKCFCSPQPFLCQAVLEKLVQKAGYRRHCRAPSIYPLSPTFKDTWNFIGETWCTWIHSSSQSLSTIVGLLWSGVRGTMQDMSHMDSSYWFDVWIHNGIIDSPHVGGDLCIQGMRTGTSCSEVARRWCDL